MGGAIYLQADASDLLCARSREWAAHALRGARRDTSLLIGNPRADFDGWCVEFAFPPSCPSQLIYALGDIRAHTDPDFPRHTLLWVIRSGRALVGSEGWEPGSQPAGTLLAFDCHQPHWLRFQHKPDRRPRMWAAFNLDRHERWTIRSAREAIRRALQTAQPLPAERSDAALSAPDDPCPNPPGAAS